MSQIFDAIPSEAEEITCLYVNASSKVQIVRVTNVANWYFERVVFPGQHLVFVAVREGMLEIHTGMMASAILSDTISCSELKVKEDTIATPSWVSLIPVAKVISA